MNAEYLDRYSYLDSPIHRLPAGTKLSVAIVLIFLILIFPLGWHWFYYPLVAGLLLAAMLSRVPLRFLARRLLKMELVFLGVAAMRLLGPEPLWSFLSLVIGATLCASLMLLVAATTRFTDLLFCLSSLGLPTLFVTTLGLMYRYLFVLSDEANRMKRARLARTYQPGRRKAWKTLSTVIAQLFVRSAERAQRIHAAMLARGWE